MTIGPFIASCRSNDGTQFNIHTAHNTILWRRVLTSDQSYLQQWRYVQNSRKRSSHVCPWLHVCVSTPSMTWTVNTKFGEHIVHDSPSTCTDPEVKRSKTAVTWFAVCMGMHVDRTASLFLFSTVNMYLSSWLSGLICWATVQRAWLASSVAWVRLPLLPVCQVRFLSACYEMKLPVSS